MNRRSFFAALAAPLLAPMRKLLPVPEIKAGTVLPATFTFKWKTSPNTCREPTFHASASTR
jgi:hypothetical protein